MTAQHYTDEDYKQLHLAHCHTEARRVEAVARAHSLAAAFVKSENENARLRNFARYIVRYAQGNRLGDHLVTKARDALTMNGWRQTEHYNAMVRHVAQAIFNRECERAYARGRVPHHAPLTPVESMPPSYRDDYFEDAKAIIAALQFN